MGKFLTLPEKIIMKEQEKQSIELKNIRSTWSGGVVVSNNKASGLSARTEDLVHKQLNPHRHEYRLSKLSGIQVHPLTKISTWRICSTPQSRSPSTSCKEEDPFFINPLWVSLKLEQPTWESHFLNAPKRSLKGSEVWWFRKVDMLRDGIEVDADGYWKELKKRRIRNAKPSIVAIAKVLTDFNSMVRWGETGSLFVSLSFPMEKKEKRGRAWERRRVVAEFD